MRKTNALEWVAGIAGKCIGGKSLNLDQLIRMSKMNLYKRIVPPLFVKTFNIGEESKKYKFAAWQLFRHARSKFDLSLVEKRLTAQDDTGTDDPDCDIGDIGSHFLDSGAFTLKTESIKFARSTGKSRWSYYDTDEFWQYIDDYAAFVKEFQIGMDAYASVDAIGNPELTYRNQKYLEEAHDLLPVPVVHFKTDLKWLRRYIDDGYSFIAFGGVPRSGDKKSWRHWADRCFEVVCETPSGIPRLRVHGFAVTAHSTMWRYPWYSVDSTTWLKRGAYGEILIPHKRQGVYAYNAQPYLMGVSLEHTGVFTSKPHYSKLHKPEKRIVDEWLELIGLSMGRVDKHGSVIEHGVATSNMFRHAANLAYFERMRAAMPVYPWAWKSARRRGMGFV